MPYRNKIYVSMDADTDIKYYYLMKAWKQSDHSSFDFQDAHDINNIYDKSEESIKAGLMERFRNTRVFVLLVGENTRYLYKYVRWEIEQALKREIPSIVVNLNGERVMDSIRCPPILKDELAVHISFNSNILQYALEDWPAHHSRLLPLYKHEPYHYNNDVYRRLGL